MHRACCPGHCDAIFGGTECAVNRVIATDIVTVNRQRPLKLIVCDPESSARFLASAIDTTAHRPHIKAPADFIKAPSLATDFNAKRAIKYRCKIEQLRDQII